MDNITPLNILIERFSKLPGIGRKTAGRLAYHVLKMPEQEVKDFARDMYIARTKIKYCVHCGMISESEVCHICADKKRDRSTVCVVKDSKDVFAFEKTREYRGLYHVLGGTLSPLEGIGPEQIAIKELLERIGKEDIKEVILATNPDIGGEATASYIAKILAPFTDIAVTRIAHGVPVGADLEYADEVTLWRALEGRIPMR